MGEKPTAADEQAADTALRESPTRASTGREAGSGMATGREAVTTAREAGPGMATGRIADVDEDGSPDIAIGDPGTNDNRQKSWLPANFREGAGGGGGSGG